MTRAVLLLATAAVSLVSVASAQTYPGMSKGATAAPPSSQSESTTRGSTIVANTNPSASVDLASVSDPVRTLTNLTVYAHGVNVGHVAVVALDNTGRPVRVAISFNNDTPRAWVAAEDVRYDAEKRQVTTQLTAAVLEKIGSMRMH